MTKKQKHWNTVLHPNRYFIWTILFLLVSFGVLFSYIHISTIKMDNDAVFSNEKTFNKYVNDDLGFDLKYPASWHIDYDPSGNIVFENPSNLEESVTITSARLDMEGIIRHSLDIVSEEKHTRENLEISVMQAQSARDGSTMDVAIIKTSNRLFYISGNSDRFEGFVNNFNTF